MPATLLGRSWLWRQLRVDLPEGSFHVLYSGRGLGFETVYVDDQVAERRAGLWFVPLFVFPIAGRLGVVEVRVWPWLTLRSFHLVVDGQVLYAEGARAPANVPLAWVEEVCRRWEATGKASREVTRKMPGLLGLGDGITARDDRTREGPVP
jgi:hypothetical protein